MPMIDSDALKAEFAKLPDLFNSSHFDALDTAVKALSGETEIQPQDETLAGELNAPVPTLEEPDTSSRGGRKGSK